MDTKTVMKVYQKSKTGEFADVLDLIECVEVTKEIAFNILICASNACYSNCKEFSNTDNQVYNLLNNILCNIDTVDEPQLVRYLQATFHIIKFMCDKEWFQDLSKMEFLIIPSFLSHIQLENIEESKQVYKAIINKLCNSIFHLSKTGKTIHNNCLLGIVKNILKASIQISAVKETLSVAQKILNSINHLKFQSNQLCEFYFILLDCVAKLLKRTNDYTEGLPVLIHIFSTIISDIIEAQEFQIVETFIDHVITQIKLGFDQQEFVKSHLIFKAVTVILPSNKDAMHLNMENCNEHINDLKTSHKEIFFNVVSFLEEPLCNVLHCYKSSGCKIALKLPSHTLINLLRLFRENICYHLVSAPRKCSCGCSLKKYYFGPLNFGCQLAGILKQYVDYNNGLDRNFYSEIEQWLAYFYELLKYVKECNCKKWSKIYKELGTYTYNIGTSLYRQENVAFVDIYRCLLRNSLKFEGFTPKLLNQNIHEVIFNVICELEYRNPDVEKCMAFAALYSLLYPQKNNSIFQNWWIKSKIKVKEDLTVQHQTLVSILENHEVTLSSIVNPNQYLDREKKLELLTLELLGYRAVWKSKESIMAAFSDFMKIADVPKIAKIILKIFGDGEIQLHEKMSAVLLKATTKIQEYIKISSDHYLKMALGVLYFYNYKESSRETVANNFQEMENTMQVVESAEKNFEAIPKDPNDECDIVSAYSNLRFNNFFEILKSLNKCVDFIGSVTNQTYEVQITKNISKLLIKIGFEYRLHCFSIKSLQAFELSLKFASRIEDNASHLLAISLLIENADVKQNFVKEMITRGDNIALLLEKDKENSGNSKTLAIYHISKGKAFLYDDAKLSFDSWKLADALVAPNESKDEFKFLRAELFILRYKLSKSCNFIDGEHEKYPMTIQLHCAMDIVIDLSHKSIVSSHEVCILFDTVFELAKIYYLMRLPRDLRAYSKNSVLLTQKLVLPMRCVSFLILLAHSDLLTCKFDHCNVKLNGVNDIFCLSQSRPITNEKIDIIEPDTKIVENEVDRCANQIQEMALDLPQHTRQSSPSSPALVVESFKTPPFLSHRKSCMCFICMSFEYHQLLLQKYHLDALINMYDNDEKIAEDFILGALRLYKTLMRNYDNYKEKAKSLISEFLVLNFDDLLREYYGNILYDYSFHLMRKSLKHEALQINTELIQLLKPKKLQFVYLYNDALLQRLSYIVPAPNGKSATLEIENAVNNLSPTRNENIIVPRTPTSKKSTVTVTISGIHKYTPPHRRLRKKCVLFNSPSDTEDALKKSPSHLATPKNKSSKKNKSENNIFTAPKTKGKKTVMPLPGTPFLGDAQTPKITIFTDDGLVESGRRSRRKQTNQLSMETSEITESSDLTNSIRKSAKKIRKTLNSAMIMDENSDGSKENCDQRLPIAGPSKSRRQLLTEKIKASTSQNKTAGVSLAKQLVAELLTGKTTVTTNGENISSNSNESEISSVNSGSPEHAIYSTRSKDILEKTKSVKKKKDTVNEGASTKTTRSMPEIKKTLFNDFADNDASGNKCTKHTGAIKKSTRNRVL